jgi:hypothetical protein
MYVNLHTYVSNHCIRMRVKLHTYVRSAYIRMQIYVDTWAGGRRRGRRAWACGRRQERAHAGLGGYSLSK